MYSMSVRMKKIKVVGIISLGSRDVSESITIDLVLAYKLLKFIYENKDKKLGIKEIAKKSGISVGSVDKYINNLATLGFIRLKKIGRKKVPELTEKGFEYLMLMERLMGLLRR